MKLLGNSKLLLSLWRNLLNSESYLVCYKFRASDRETESNTGIDYSKAVVISKPSYLGEETNINDKEYLELQEKTYFIISKFKKYVEGYIDYKKNGGDEYIAKRYRFSTLNYFDAFLINNR